MQNMDEEVSLGRLLREARESKGMSIETVANELHVSTSIIRMIESDEYDLSAKDSVFMRGYIRLYARLVNLSEDEVGDVFRSLGLVAEVRKIPKREAIKIKQVSFKDKPVKLITNFVIIILVILLLIWWYSHFVANNSKAAQSPVVVTEQPASSSQTSVSTPQPKVQENKPVKNNAVTNEANSWHNPDEISE
ncbi:MAG: helix-turn-helix domain-containing protein [Gammaproteobacteria bacterium]|jgi:cytoskeleton protein RodZ